MHPLEVARMVADYSFKTDTIITAIYMIPSKTQH
ncbi:hypothetical protein OTSTA763_2402 [Orientia tsutsugamushi str. TA763]|nr:hypothetical protein OTSTA763_2402 [Orientia tsutsugamushi str. TA763]